MKPKTQRPKKKKPQEQALKQARLKQKTKPQPAPEKPKVIQTTTPAMKSRMKPIRGKMVESQQKPKPLAGAMRTAGQPMVVAGRMTRQQMLERKKKRMMSGRMKKNKPLRRS